MFVVNVTGYFLVKATKATPVGGIATPVGQHTPAGVVIASANGLMRVAHRVEICFLTEPGTWQQSNYLY